MVYTDKSNFQDRREYFRINFKTPVEFKVFSDTQLASLSPQEIAYNKGSTQNISQSGIFFQTTNRPPQVSSILWMKLDTRTLSICQEIEKRALIHNDGLVGRVVRVEEDVNDNRIYDVGICFLTQDQKEQKQIKELLSVISRSR